MSSATSRAAWSGLRAILPSLGGILPFGTAVGALAAQLGVTPGQSLVLGGVFFAGMAELAALELLAAGAPLLVVLGTVLVVNLRLFVYSFSFAGLVRELPRPVRALIAFVLTDQPYAMTVAYGTPPRPARECAAYFVGAGVPLWLTWQAAHWAGYALGLRVSDAWAIDFAVPLTFLSVLVPLASDVRLRLTALAAGLAVPLTDALPLQTGLLAAVAVGVGAGLLVPARGPREEEPTR